MEKDLIVMEAKRARERASEVALGCAMQLVEKGHNPTDIVETAKSFRVFLLGEG